MGGREPFVRSGDDAIIKPNKSADWHPPECAATADPSIVAVLGTPRLGTGARRVRAMDMPFGGTPESAYIVSGIDEAVREAGAGWR